MCDDLKNYGLEPRKSTREKFPYIDENYMRHMIRGFLDGDGCISNTKRKNRRLQTNIQFYSGYEFIRCIKDYLINKLNIRDNKIINRGNYFMVMWENHNDVQKIIDFLYTDANIYMKRKFNKILDNTVLTLPVTGKSSVTHR